MMDTLNFRDNAHFASAATAGVLPVPPAVRFPTLTTNPGSLFFFRIPRAYAAYRSLCANPYNNEKNANTGV